jgi:hypothetical protein
VLNITAGWFPACLLLCTPYADTHEATTVSQGRLSQTTTVSWTARLICWFYQQAGDNPMTVETLEDS